MFPVIRSMENYYSWNFKQQQRQLQRKKAKQIQNKQNFESYPYTDRSLGMCSMCSDGYRSSCPSLRAERIHKSVKRTNEQIYGFH